MYKNSKKIAHAISGIQTKEEKKMVNEVNNGHNLTLTDFENLANNVQNQNEEVRIRKSNGLLSNRKLGFFSRNFGSTHKNSNISVNRAFINSLKNDPKYAGITDKIETLFSTQNLEKALTPGKIKSTIDTVDNLLTKYETATNLTNNAVECGLISDAGNDKTDFKNFVFEYLKQNPDTRLSLQDFTEATTLEEKKAQINILSDILSSFYEKNQALENSPNYNLTDAQCSDPEKKKSIMNLLNNSGLLTLEHDKKNLKDLFRIKDSELKDIQGSPFNAFNDIQQKRIKSIFGTRFEKGTDNIDLALFNKEDIDKLNSTLQSLTKNHRATAAFKRNIVNMIGLVAKGILDEFPDTDNDTKTKAMDNICKIITDAFPNNPENRKLLDSFKVVYAESLLEKKLIKVDGKEICEKYNIDPEVGIALIEHSDFGTKLKKEIGLLSKRDAIAEHFTRELDAFLKENAYILDEALTEAPVTKEEVNTNGKVEEVITKDLRKEYVNSQVIANEIGKLLRKDNPQKNELLLNSFISLNNQLKNLSNNDANKLLDSLIENHVTSEYSNGTFTGLEQDDILNLLRDNRENFDAVIKNLKTAANDPKNAAIADFLQETALLVESFYNRSIISSEENLFKTAVLDPETTDPKFQGVYLQATKGIQNDAPVNENNVAPEQKEKSNKINLNASPADIIFAEQRLRTEDKFKDLLEKTKVNAIDLMRKTSCDNLELIVAIAKDDVIYKDFVSGFETLRKPNDSSFHHLQNFSRLGKHVKEVAKDSGLDIDDIREFFVHSNIVSSSKEELESFYSIFTAPENVVEYEVMNTQSTKEIAAMSEKGLAEGAKNLTEILENSQNKSPEYVQIALNFANQLKAGIEKNLNKESTGRLYDYNNKVPFTKVPFDDLYVDELLQIFPNAVTELDTKLAANKVQLDDKEMKTFTDFFNSLKLPGNKTVGELSKKDSFEIKYKSIEKGPDNQDKFLTETFDKSALIFMYAPYAKEIAELCNQTNNKPTPEQIWGIIHGGNAPEGLTLENLNEKLLSSLCAQTQAYGKMTGLALTASNMDWIFKSHGVPVFKFFEKMKDIAHNDVTFNFEDQKTGSGFFAEADSSNYKNGEENYGFALDFIRSRMPPGAYDPNKTRAEQEGSTITVINNNETVKYSRKEMMAHENTKFEEKHHPYIDGIVKHIDGLCKSKEQLAMVGAITTQITNRLTWSAHMYYKDISGGTLEHVANDYIVTKEGDNINVKLSSKPGAPYKLYVEYEVRPDGTATIKAGSVTLPKLSTQIARAESSYS